MRDKLIELLSENFAEFCHVGIIAGDCKIKSLTLDVDALVDYLIANGVTIKPLLTIPERADIERICQSMVWKCTEMRQPGMWECYTRHMECGEIREFAQYYKDMETLYKALTGHEMFAPSLEDKS